MRYACEYMNLYIGSVTMDSVLPYRHTLCMQHGRLHRSLNCQRVVVVVVVAEAPNTSCVRNSAQSKHSGKRVAIFRTPYGMTHEQPVPTAYLYTALTARF